MLLEALRMVVVVFLVVGGFWRFALSKSYFGMLRSHTFVRLWVGGIQLLVLFVPILPSVATWMVAICLDIGYAHADRRPARFVPVTVLAMVSIWLAWFVDPLLSRVVSWFFVCAVAVFVVAFWPIFAPRRVYVYTQRPRAAVYLCPVFTLAALGAAVFTEVYPKWALLWVLASVFVYDWFFTWRFALQSLFDVSRGNQIDWDE